MDDMDYPAACPIFRGSGSLLTKYKSALSEGSAYEGWAQVLLDNARQEIKDDFSLVPEAFQIASDILTTSKDKPLINTALGLIKAGTESDSSNVTPALVKQVLKVRDDPDNEGCSLSRTASDVLHYIAYQCPDMEIPSPPPSKFLGIFPRKPEPIRSEYIAMLEPD